MNNENTQIFIVSAPSGTGKGVLIKHALSVFSGDLVEAVSTTSRERRPDDKHGLDYYFVSKEEFKEKISNDEFIEWEEVYEGDYYGTTKRELRGLVRNGNKNILFEIDVKGMESLKSYLEQEEGFDVITIFIDCDMDEREQRLRSRGDTSEGKIKERMKTAEEEVRKKPLFDEVVINEDLDIANSDMESVIREYLK
jgi:guanylate kinase